jgi:NADPH:quinone reductase-like Zn-dependent oxidoreductase
VRAVVLDGFGGLEALVYKDIPKPEPMEGTVVIKIKAFGINHAEMHMRRGEWAEAAPVSGIECVGIVDACPGGEFVVGTKVAALMGGLGRTIGSFVFGTPGFPLSDVPLQQIAADIAAGKYSAKPSRIFRFDEIREAHRVMEANQANGKMVVVHDE